MTTKEIESVMEKHHAGHWFFPCTHFVNTYDVYKYNYNVVANYNWWVAAADSKRNKWKIFKRVNGENRLMTDALFTLEEAITFIEERESEKC